MIQPTTYTLPVPGATLHYDVRGESGSSGTALFLIASPMDAAANGRRAPTSPRLRSTPTISTDSSPRSTPNPEDFGLPTEDDGSRDDVMFGQNLRTIARYRPAFDVLRKVSTRIVVVAGRESAGQIAHRVAVADRLGTTAIMFPSHHDGFLGGEFGMHGEPAAFAGSLRRVLGYDDRIKGAYLECSTSPE